MRGAIPILYIHNDSRDPYYNLAFEEYALTRITEDDVLLLWQNDRTIVVGRYQNTLEEINERETSARGIKIVRRNTGGGAVYHVAGNLNFSFITDFDPDAGLDYDRFTGPVAAALQKMGVAARPSGRNDIVGPDGRKISGNAQCVRKGRILHHGTLLFNSDLEVLQLVLNVSSDKISSKGIKSIRSRVANLTEYTDEIPDVQTLKDVLLAEFFGGDVVNEHTLTPGEFIKIKSLAATKYETWDWNFGLSPAFNFKNAVRFPAGKIEVNLDLRESRIHKCRMRGDFLAVADIAPVENALVGCRLDVQDIREALSAFDIPYFFGVSIDELLVCFG